MVLILIFSVVALDLVGLSDNSSYLYVRGSIVVVCLAASLVEIAIESKPIKSKVISNLGISTLGVYFIHEHPFVRDYIWKELFDNSLYTNSAKLILHFFISCLIVFVVCLVIDCARNLIFGKLELSISIKISSFLEKSLRKIKKENFCL